MLQKEWIGKYIIRTKPAQCSYGKDNSYRSVPLLLKYFDEYNVILTSTEGAFENRDIILDSNWLVDWRLCPQEIVDAYLSKFTKK